MPVSTLQSRGAHTVTHKLPRNLCNQTSVASSRSPNTCTSGLGQPDRGAGNRTDTIESARRAGLTFFGASAGQTFRPAFHSLEHSVVAKRGTRPWGPGPRAAVEHHVAKAPYAPRACCAWTVGRCHLSETRQQTHDALDPGRSARQGRLARVARSGAQEVTTRSTPTRIRTARLRLS